MGEDLGDRGNGDRDRVVDGPGDRVRDVEHVPGEAGDDLEVVPGGAVLAGPQLIVLPPRPARTEAPVEQTGPADDRLGGLLGGRDELTRGLLDQWYQNADERALPTALLWSPPPAATREIGTSGFSSLCPLGRCPKTLSGDDSARSPQQHARESLTARYIGHHSWRRAL